MGRIFLAFAMLFITGAQSSTALAQESTSPAEVNIAIVLDVSGSMAGATDTQEMRMTAAQRVLNEVVQAIPQTEGVNVGLRIYGHVGNNTESGKAVSCAGSELVVPIEGLNKELLTSQINSLQPTGWTPLGASIDLAAEDLRAVAEPESTNAIIVLTDGLETCGGNPVAAAANALSGTPSMRTHVIGFALTPEDQALIGEVAQAGGGEPINANNAGQLISALFTVLEELEIVDEGGDGSTREAPISVGRIGRVGDYDLNVVSITPNANALVESENSFNDSPQPGNQFFLAKVAVTYVGTTTGQPSVDLDLQAVGDLNTGYAWYTDMCGVIPDDPFSTISELFPGGSAEYNVCWQIDAADSDSLLMYASPLLDFNAAPVWFSLGNSGNLPASRSSEATPERSGGDMSGLKAADTQNADEENPTNDAGRGDGSDRTLPIPIGQVGQVGDYDVMVISATPYANDIVAAENQFNELPAEGNQFFMVRVAVTYTGTASGMPAAELDFQAVGDLNKGYA